MWRIGKYDYVGCPEKLLDDVEMVQTINLWTEWKTFGLRYPGSYGEQPAVYVDLLREMDAESKTVKVKNGDG